MWHQYRESTRAVEWKGYCERGSSTKAKMERRVGAGSRRKRNDPRPPKLPLLPLLRLLCLLRLLYLYIRTKYSRIAPNSRWIYSCPSGR